jgi:hypothetical protein
MTWRIAIIILALIIGHVARRLRKIVYTRERICGRWVRR